MSITDIDAEAETNCPILSIRPHTVPGPPIILLISVDSDGSARKLRSQQETLAFNFWNLGGEQQMQSMVATFFFMKP